MDLNDPRGRGVLPFWTKHLWSIEQIENPQPRFYELDLTNYCNWNCSWCVSKEIKKQPKANMEKSLFMRILDEAMDKRIGIVLTGGGEPTLHPDFKEFVDIIINWIQRKQLLGFGLVSNGGTDWQNVQYFLEKTKFLFSERKVSIWLRISVNAFPISMHLIELIHNYPKRVGISLIYDTPQEFHLCEANKLELEKHPVEFIRGPKKCHDWSTPTVNPVNCMGRKFHKVFETLGNVPYCCLSRGLGHEMPKVCPEGCPWNMNFDSLWEANPFT